VYNAAFTASEEVERVLNYALCGLGRCLLRGTSRLKIRDSRNSGFQSGVAHDFLYTPYFEGFGFSLEKHKYRSSQDFVGKQVSFLSSLPIFSPLLNYTPPPSTGYIRLRHN
jgi:hypothetical protein